MILDDVLISKLEDLARLKLSVEERQMIKKDLNAIIAMLDKLHEVDTTGIEPLTHLHESRDVFRNTVGNEPLDREIALKNAPHSEGPYFVVPNLLKKRDKKR